MIRSAVSQQKRRRCFVFHRIRNRHNGFCVNTSLFGHAAIAAQREYALSDFYVTCVGTDFENFTGNFGARRERHRRTHLVFAGNHQDIRKINAAGKNANTHLLVPHLRFIDLFENQLVRGTVCFAKNRLQSIAPWIIIRVSSLWCGEPRLQVVVASSFGGTGADTLYKGILRPRSSRLLSPIRNTP